MAVVEIASESPVFTEIVKDAEAVARDSRHADYGRRKPDFGLETIEDEAGSSAPYDSVNVLRNTMRRGCVLNGDSGNCKGARRRTGRYR